MTPCVQDATTPRVPTANACVVSKVGEESSVRKKAVQDCTTGIVQAVGLATVQLKFVLVIQGGQVGDVSKLDAQETPSAPDTAIAQFSLVIEYYAGVMSVGWEQLVKPNVSMVLHDCPLTPVTFSAPVITATAVSPVKWNVLEKANV